MRIDISRIGKIYFLLVSPIKLSVAQDLEARFGDRVIIAAFGTDITSMGLAPGDEIVSAGYHLHSLDTAVFVALHHAIGADTPIMIVNKGVENTHLPAALLEGGEMTANAIQKAVIYSVIQTHQGGYSLNTFNQCRKLVKRGLNRLRIIRSFGI